AVVASTKPASNRLLLGPIRSRRRAQLAARALLPEELAAPARALPRLRRRLAVLEDARRCEDAARQRDRVQALERVCRELDRLARMRAVERCVLAPALEPGHVRAFFVAGGRVCAERTLPPGGGAHLEVEAGLAAARRALREDEPGDLDELYLVGTFLRRPPPELKIVRLDRETILRTADAIASARVIATR
ncbi:MAG TPA: hypothetical protein VFL60_09990, partial [Gaiellaceae bacterium]|nr:hypothetical protein [Gaiellaceae bacterium]